MVDAIKEYHAKVPFIVNTDDYESAWYQYTGDYYLAMVKALAMTKAQEDHATAMLGDAITPPPTLVKYHIQVTYS